MLSPLAAALGGTWSRRDQPDDAAPVTGLSMIWVYGVGYVFGVSPA